jgi:hypothetical protein
MMLSGYMNWGSIFIKSFISLVPIFALLIYAIKKKQTSLIWLSTACSLGNFIVWGLATFGLAHSKENFISEFYASTWHLRGVYALILTTGISLGTLLILSVSSKQKVSSIQAKQDSNNSQTPNFVTLCLVFVYLVYILFAYLQGNLLNRGTTSRTLAVDSIAYITGGLTYIKFAFFYAFGSQTPKRVSNSELIIRILFILLLSAPLFFSGGREFGIMCGLFFIVGIGLSKAGPSVAFQTGAIIVPFLAVVYIILGFLRQDFSEQTLTERFMSAVEFTDFEDSLTENTEAVGGPWSRLAEAGTHIVIDHIHRTRGFEGFRDFERIYQDILPRFINPSRNVHNYGGVVLQKEYDLTYTEFTASPLTTIAGAYRRWGVWGIFVVGFFIGIILTLWSKFCQRIKPVWLRNLILCILTYYSFRLYTKEVVALGNALTYSMLRTLVILLIFSYGMVALQKLLAGPRDNKSRIS